VTSWRAAFGVQVLIVLTSVGFTKSSAWATVTEWKSTVTNGSWNNGSNWTSGTPFMNVAEFGMDGSYTVTCPSPLAPIAGLTVLAQPTSTLSVLLGGGTGPASLNDSGGLTVEGYTVAASGPTQSTLYLGTTGAPLNIAAQGPIYVILGGQLNVEFGSSVSGTYLDVGVQSGTDSVTISGSGSQINILPNMSTPSQLGVGSGASGSLTVTPGGAFNNGLGDTFNLAKTGMLTINSGGSANLQTLNWTGGSIDFQGGTLSYLGDLTLQPGGVLGSFLTLGSTQSLTLSGTTTVNAGSGLAISAGALSTGSLVNKGTFTFGSGTLNITGVAGLTVGPGGGLGSNLTLSSGQTWNVTNAVTIAAGSTVTANSGSKLSSGTIANSGSLVAAGIVSVSGTVSGTGSLTVNPGGSLAASAIVQQALIIGGNASKSGVVTIVPSATSGAAIAESGNFALVRASSFEAVDGGDRLTSSERFAAPSLVTTGDGKWVPDAAAAFSPGVAGIDAIGNMVGGDFGENTNGEEPPGVATPEPSEFALLAVGLFCLLVYWSTVVSKFARASGGV
jgi:hypothetical protein